MKCPRKDVGQAIVAGLQPGALDRKTKTLMCLAIGIANGAEYCVAARAAQAQEAGATLKELLETAAVGLLMEGDWRLARF